MSSSGPPPAQAGGGAVPVSALASDRDRERLVERLNQACVDGRLDLASFSDRVEAALAARTVAEIQALEVDLGQPASTLVPTVPDRSKTAWFIGVMSQSVRRGRWVLQPRSHALAVMGECVLDLRRAEVHQGQSHITAVAVMGSVRVIVPEGIEIDLDGVAIMGAKTFRGSEADPLPGSPAIRVTAVSVMGEVSVVSEPATGTGDQQGWGPGGRQGLLPRHARRSELRQLRGRHRRRWAARDDEDS